MKKMYAAIKIKVKLFMIRAYRNPVIRENTRYMMVWPTDLNTVSG